MTQSPQPQSPSGMDPRTVRLLNAMANASPAVDALAAARQRAGSARSLADLSDAIHTVTTIRRRLLAHADAITARANRVGPWRRPW